jgi:hypothetical protein
MTERPIDFSDAMVRALLGDTKTQMRTMVKPQPLHTNGLDPWTTLRYFGDGLAIECGPDYPDGESDKRRCPYGQPGDRLWVREAHAFSVVDPEGRDWHDDPENWDVIYRADKQPGGGWRDGEGNQIAARWRQSIHMPRGASRITLEITEVRVEKLQEISEADAKAEGACAADPCDHARRSCADIGCGGPQDYRGGYRALWESINGPDSWDANPFVWAISFKRLTP